MVNIQPKFNMDRNGSKKNTAAESMQIYRRVDSRIGVLQVVTQQLFAH